jgi:hypothetical protein
MPGYIYRSMCGCSVHGEILHSFACLLQRYRKASGRIPEGGALFEARGGRHTGMAVCSVALPLQTLPLLVEGLQA